MVKYTINEEIGDYLSFDRTVGDVIEVICKNGEFTAEIEEVPDSMPVSERDESEIIAVSTETDKNEDSVNKIQEFALYAYVRKTQEMKFEYDVYAIELQNKPDSTKDLGEIQKIIVEE